MIYDNYDKYEGDWKNDVKEGKGIYYYKKGGFYEGDFINDKREGNGIMIYDNGNKYDGEWKILLGKWKLLYWSMEKSFKKW